MVRLANFNILKLITFTVMFYIYAVYLVKFKKFGYISSSLEKKLLNKKSQFDERNIFKFERRVARLLNIKKCLISSICLFYLFKHFGLECQLNIGINKLNKFNSHAWVETVNGSFLKDPEDKYKIIRSFK